MDDILSQAMQKKHDEAQKAMDLFKQMHKMMHDDMAAPIVKLESSCEPS